MKKHLLVGFLCSMLVMSVLMQCGIDPVSNVDAKESIVSGLTKRVYEFTGDEIPESIDHLITITLPKEVNTDNMPIVQVYSVLDCSGAVTECDENIMTVTDIGLHGIKIDMGYDEWRLNIRHNQFNAPKLIRVVVIY
jgi:hypothetical protein